MNITKKLYRSLSLLLLVGSFLSVFAHNEAQFDQEMADENHVIKSVFKDSDDSNCNVIKVGKLKAQRVLAQCIDAKKIDAGCVDSDSLRSYDLSAQSAYLGSLSSQTVCVNKFISRSADTQTLCTHTLSVAGKTSMANLSAVVGCVTTLASHDVCVSGSLKVADLLNCGRYRATAVFDTNTTYTLGDFINWNVILDNPNHDIIVTPTFAYVAPLSGYYLVTLQVDQNQLSVFNGNPVLGVPVSNPQILVNGVVFRQSYVPYLTFFNEQKTTLTAIISLTAGDTVQTVFEVLALNQTNGVIPIGGTVNILGDGTEGDQSIFKISLLNINCTDMPCTPCTPEECTPWTPQQCSPASNLTPCGPCETCTPCQCC